MAKFFEKTSVCFSTPQEMAASAIGYFHDGSSPGDTFAVERVTLVSNRGDAALRSVMTRQRNAVANGYETRKVYVDDVSDYEMTPRHVVQSPREVKRFHPRSLDMNVRQLLDALCLDAVALREAGLVLCGGSILESALRDTPLTLAQVSAMGDETGFDIDFFVTNDAAYMGYMGNYATALARMLGASGHVMNLETKNRGFACDVFVEYKCGAVVKMQIVDLGVAASPMALVQSFDVSPAKMYFCAGSNRVVMTEDAAMALVNGVVPYDRRFIGDPRYASRLAKYLGRTGFSLALPDSAAMASLEVVRAFEAKVGVSTASCTDIRRDLVAQRLGSWISEMDTSDVTTFATVHVLIERFGGATNKRGYGNTPRHDDFRPITGGIGRQGLSLLGPRTDPVVELFGFFQLFRMAHEIAVFCG
jgi:hypothetical protein